MGASVTGDALRRFHLPRLTGYLIFGVIVGPYLANLITESMAAQLQVVTGIATTLIAFIAGLTLSVERLGARLAAIARMTAATLAVAIVGMSASGGWSGRGCPSRRMPAGFQRLVMLAMLVVMVVSFSPTMTAAVVADSGARGRLSDTVLAMVVLADLVVLVLFSVSMQLARVVFDTGGAGGVERAGAAGVGDRRRGRVRRADRRAVRALSALHRPRDHAGAAGGVRRAQPGRHDAATPAAAGRGGRRRGHREPGRGAGRRAARRGAARRAARAGGVLRGGGRVAASRCAWRPSGCSASRLSAVRLGFIRLGVGGGRHGLRPAGTDRHVRVDRAGVAGRHHARVRVGRRHGVSRAGATRCSCCGRVDRDPRARGPDPVSPRPGPGRRARAPRAAAAGGGVEP